MSIPFPGNDDTPSVLPDGVVAGVRKRKQAFSLNDPDNVELQRLATQAAKKKAKLSKHNPVEKNSTNNKAVPKPNCQPSVEEVDDADHDRPCAFPRNPKNILESIEDRDGDVQMANVNKKYSHLVDNDDDEEDDEDKVEIQ